MHDLYCDGSCNRHAVLAGCSGESCFCRFQLLEYSICTRRTVSTQIKQGESGQNSTVLCTMSEAYTAPMLSFLSGTPGQKSIEHPWCLFGCRLLSDKPGQNSLVHPCYHLGVPPLRRARSEVYSAPIVSLWVPPSLRQAGSELSSAPMPSL